MAVHVRIEGTGKMKTLRDCGESGGGDGFRGTGGVRSKCYELSMQR